MTATRYDPFFTDPGVWPQHGMREVSAPVQLFVETHKLLVRHHGHDGIYHCPCALAVASGLSKHCSDPSRQAWKGVQ